MSLSNLALQTPLSAERPWSSRGRSTAGFRCSPLQDNTLHHLLRAQQRGSLLPLFLLSLLVARKPIIISAHVWPRTIRSHQGTRSGFFSSFYLKADPRCSLHQGYLSHFFLDFQMRKPFFQLLCALQTSLTAGGVPRPSLT